MLEASARSDLEAFWEERITPALSDYIAIPCKSPAFDPHWAEAGHLDRAFALAASFCEEHAPPGLRVEVVRRAGLTPLLLLEMGTEPGPAVLLYGHLDKQPEMTGWEEGLAPWTPVRRGDRLYGRGGGDDGYAVFACLAAMRALHASGQPHARLVALIEGSEESGSPDLPAHVEALAARIGEVDLVICLDSGCGDYDRLWCTTSLRGLVSATLEIGVLSEGVHSGGAGGIVPSSFSVARQLLDRVEDAASGRVLLDACHVEIPEEREDQAHTSARVLGPRALEAFPWLPGVRALADDTAELLLARTWRPALEVVGAAGLPAPADAGNVLRPSTTLKLSLRLPPTCPAAEAAAALRGELLRDPPHGAHVEVKATDAATGWNAPPTSPWLDAALERASQAAFGPPPASMGEGGTIPFMGMLGRRFPAAQFVVTGVLGPRSNAHGPNEFLHLPTARRISAVVADVIAEHHARPRD